MEMWIFLKQLIESFLTLMKIKEHKKLHKKILNDEGGREKDGLGCGHPYW